MNLPRLKPVAMAIALFLATNPAVVAESVTVTTSLNNTSKTIDEEKNGIDPYLRLNEIPWRSAKDFMKRFPAIDTDKWLKINDGYLAKFTDGKYPVKVYYDNQGRFISVIRYYEEEELAPETKTLVTSRYKDFSIMGITEVKTDDGKFYHINIKNHSTFKVLLVKGEMIEVLSDMQNGESAPGKGS